VTFEKTAWQGFVSKAFPGLGDDATAELVDLLEDVGWYAEEWLLARLKALHAAENAQDELFGLLLDLDSVRLGLGAIAQDLREVYREATGREYREAEEELEVIKTSIASWWPAGDHDDVSDAILSLRGELIGLTQDMETPVLGDDEVAAEKRSELRERLDIVIDAATALRESLGDAG
jgi:hypothetical protein